MSDPLEVHGYYFEQLSVGMSDTYSRTITDADVNTFADVSGDTNPLHLDAEFASRTRFKERISHGMLTASFISTVIGTRLPGPGCIYMQQNLKFSRPVMIGDAVTARATVTELIERRNWVRLDTVCLVDDKTVISGDALVYVPSQSDPPQSD